LLARRVEAENWPEGLLQMQKLPKLSEAPLAGLNHEIAAPSGLLKVIVVDGLARGLHNLGPEVP